MAQRAEKEEAEFKVVPETTSLCVKCGGVAGNSPTNNLCQKCSNATTTASTSTAAAGATTSLGGARPLEHISFRSRSLPDSKPNLAETNRDLKKEASTTAGAAPPTRREVNRCSSCRRKVGLTVFRCRCGELFCADHRYSDRHDCSFDYKAAGREAIARENPVVKAAKIIKI